MSRAVRCVLLVGVLLWPLGAWAGEPEPVAGSAESSLNAILQLRTRALGLTPDPALTAPPGLDLETTKTLPGDPASTAPAKPSGPGETYVTVTICGPDGVSRTYTYALGEEGKVLERIYGDLSGPGQLDRQRLGPPPLPGRRR